MTALHGWLLWVATADPHGLEAGAAIDARSLDRVEALYGAAPTGDLALAWSPDGMYVAVVGSTLEIFDARTGRIERGWSLSGLYAEAVAWSPDGSEIAVTASEGTSGPFRLTVYSPTGIIRNSWPAHDDYGSEGLAWSPDGTRLLSISGGHRGEFAIWETGSWRELLRAGDGLTTGSSASWSPDGTRFALGASPVVVVDAATGGVLWEDQRGVDWARAAWSPRGDLIAVGTSSGRLRFHQPNGTVVADLPVPSTDLFGTEMSWSPDGRFLAAASRDGIRVVDADRAAVVRHFVFPVGEFRQESPTVYPSFGGDRAVVWSPRGTSIAALGTTSGLPSFRMWAIRSSPLPLALSLLGIVWILGFAVALGDDLRFALRHPNQVVDILRTTDPRFVLGFALFGVAIVLSVIIGIVSDLLGRVHGVQPIPSFPWYVTMAALSAGLTVVPAFAAARAFVSSTIRPGTVGPGPEFAPRILGVVLMPSLLALGAVPLVHAAALASGVPLAVVDDTYAIPVVIGGILGLGAMISSRIAHGLPGVSRWRAWGAIAASAVVSLAVFFGLFLLLFLMLNITRFQPFGDLLHYGITVNFAFGLVPLVVVLTLVATAAIGGVATTFVHTFWPGYARSHGEQVMALESRKAVMSLVEQNPGVHFRDLLRLSRLGSGTVHYHLYVLEREGFVVGRRDGIVKRFYPVPQRQRAAGASA